MNLTKNWSNRHKLRKMLSNKKANEKSDLKILLRKNQNNKRLKN